MNSHTLRKQMIWISMFATLLLSGYAIADNRVDLAQSPEVNGSQQQINVPKQQDKMALNYVNQPPMIPHSIEGYQVTLNTNSCLNCHGIQSYRTTRAPRISPTHFMDANGNVLTDVAPRRYFCIACHVPQTEAAPIVENEFKPAPGFGQ